MKSEGKLVCQGSSDAAGETDMIVTLQQINQDSFMKIDKLTSSSMGDAELDAEIASFFASLTGKWVQLDNNDPLFLGYKDDGVLFNLLGATSKDFNEQEVADILKEKNVITILSSKNTKHEGRAVVEYDLAIRRSAFEKFMDRMHSGFSYKDQVLDTLFESNTEEVSIVVDQNDKSITQTRYTSPNLCAEFLSFVDEDAAFEVPSRMHIKSTATDKRIGTIDKIEKPGEFLTIEEFMALVYEEETVEE